MKRPVFDSSAFISYKRQIVENEKILRAMSLSLVVLCELTATNIKRETLQLFEQWRENYHQDGLLIVPSMLDFWNTAKKIRALKIAEEKDFRKLQRPPDDALRLQNDALIAYTVGQTENCYVVTSNVKDFERLQRVIDFEFQSSEEFFGL